jgi:small nuclear ribonucleoprotein (snRNP)-like protein
MAKAASIASAIGAALIKYCGIDAQQPDEDRQSFLKRCIRGVNDLSDKDFDRMPDDVSKWYNSAADVIDANKKDGRKDPLPDFPDAKEEKDEPAPSRRRGKADDEPAGAKPGDQVTVVKKNGRELTGKLVERTKDVVVIEVDGKEKEIDDDDVETVKVFNDGKGAPADDGERGPRPGDQVTFTTKRGKVVTGELVEINDESVVVKDDKGEDDYDLARIDGEITIVGAEKPAAEEKASSSRRAAKKDDDKGGGKGGGDEKPARVVNKGGVSVGQRIRELVGEDPDITLDDVTKALKKDGIEFRDVTVKMNYEDCQKLVAELKKNNNLK